jgi:branched-chain amino acid aminotransferase
MGTIVNIDGNLLSPEDAHVSVFDHGFLFGDSVYEVVRTHCGVLFALEEHLERLRLSAGAIKLAVEADDLEVADEILRTVEAGGNTESYVRLIISRGTGEIDLHPASCKRPRMIIIAQPYRPLDGAYYTRGAEVALVSIERTSQASLNPSIKSGNYLNNILAIMEARASGALEAVMLNSRGFIAECTTSNIFLVKGGKVLTPSLGARCSRRRSARGYSPASRAALSYGSHVTRAWRSRRRTFPRTISPARTRSLLRARSRISCP